jgi:carbon starvation protein
VTFTAGWMKIFSPKAAGFLPAVRKLQGQLDAGVPATQLHAVERALFNARLDIAVVVVFLSCVALITSGCVWEWWCILRGTKPAEIHESPYVVLADP